MVIPAETLYESVYKKSDNGYSNRHSVESVLCNHTAVGNIFFHYLQSILKRSPNIEGANSLVAYYLSSRT